MSNETVLIVGAGQAAAQTAASLRQGGFEGAITIVGDEPSLPYQRPPLSKAYLKGDLEHERLYFKNAEWYTCLLYTSPSPRDGLLSRMPSSA